MEMLWWRQIHKGSNADMATLFFPELEMLRLALTGGAIPAPLSRSPARAGSDERGQVWLETDVPLPRATVFGLQLLGAQFVSLGAGTELHPVCCWQQVLPLQAGPMPDETGPPILLELTAGRLPAVAAELRRLGATAVEFRWWQSPRNVLPGTVEEFPEMFDAEVYNAGEHGIATLFMPSPLSVTAQPAVPDDDRVLLRVQPAPFLTLLKISQGDLIAYVEQAPHVWVEAGRRHITAEQIVPQDGQIVLLRSPRTWTFLDDLPFHRDLGAFPLQPSRTQCMRADKGAHESFTLPLRLEESDDARLAELWVIHERPLEQLTTWVRDGEDAFLARFEFALVEPRGRPILLLRVKPSAQPLPVVLLTGLGCRPYLKMPNLFVPCGLRLTPPLRRDAARYCLAANDQRLHVLLPASGGNFVPVSVPESAFQPLESWVEHRVEKTACAWQCDAIQPLPDWHGFVLKEQPMPEHVVAVADVVAVEEVVAADETPAPVTSSSLFARLKKFFRPSMPAPARTEKPKNDMDAALLQALPAEVAPAVESIPRHDLEERQLALERRFLEHLSPQALAERQAIWPELAGLHAQLDQPAEAALCWLNALWDREAPPAFWYRGWLQAEKHASRILFDEKDLLSLLETTPSPSSMRLLAAVVVWLAQNEPPRELSTFGATIRLLLIMHESWLPVRAAWLVQCSLSRLAGGDDLALAQARDRLLERLAPKGLSLELDVPAFLRFAGRDSSDRFPTVRTWLPRIREHVQQWNSRLVKNRPDDYVKPPEEPVPDRDGRCTRAYFDLMLAWGLARLGEENAGREFWQNGREVLERCDDPEHRFLSKAFGQRILQALDGKPAGGPLSNELLAELDGWRADATNARLMWARFRVDALRQHSRILEPTEKVNAAENGVRAGYADDLRREIGALQQLHDREQLLDRIQKLLAKLPHDAPARLPALETILALVPRLGEAFARELLAHMDEEMKRLPDPFAQALLLEKEISLATHFGLSEAVGELVIRLLRLFEAKAFRFVPIVQKLLHPAAGETPGPVELHRLEQLPGQCLQALRRFGMTAEVSRLRSRAVEWVLQRVRLGQLRTEQPDTWMVALRTLLNMVGGWFGDADDEHALAVLDLARKELPHSAESPVGERTALACAYVRALGQAPVRLAQARFEELFGGLEGLYDDRRTNSHFAIAPLMIVDTMVLAVVNEDFALGPIVRRWLDDDELSVRQRLRKEVRQLSH